MALLLDRATIQGLLDIKEAVDLIEQAFAELDNQTVDMPQRLAMTDAEHSGWTAFMPAHLKAMGALGAKAVTVFRNNPSKHQLPSTLATIVLLDQETGKALSIMDGGYITAMRTGAVSGVATRFMARADVTVAGVLGMGVQARTQLSGICTVRPIKRVVCFSVDPPQHKKAFAGEMAQQLGIEVKVVDSVQQVVEQADVLALATTSAGPIVNGDWLKPGAHINSIGSHTPSARELDTRSIVRSKVVCDLTEACMAEAGDLLIPIQEGAFAWDRVYAELGQVVTGRKNGREDDREITLFKSVGLSIQDIATAHFVYKKALERGVGVSFEFSASSRSARRQLCPKSNRS